MKFSIRDLLLMTVIVALAVGWWVEHRKVVALKEEAEVNQLGHAFITATWDDIMNELDKRKQQLGEPTLEPVYSSSPNSSAPAPNQPSREP